MITEHVKKWIVKAGNDLRVAEHEIEGVEPVTDAICFHAQQSVEKYLKAFLVYHNKPFRKTHNIAELIELCAEIDGDFQKLEEIKAHELTVYATELRYPEFFHLPSMDEARECFEIAKKVRKFILKKLGIEKETE